MGEGVIAKKQTKNLSSNGTPENLAPCTKEVKEKIIVQKDSAPQVEMTRQMTKINVKGYEQSLFPLRASLVKMTHE